MWDPLVQRRYLAVSGKLACLTEPDGVADVSGQLACLSKPDSDAAITLRVN